MDISYAIEILKIKRDGIYTNIRQREFEGVKNPWLDKVESESVAALDMAIDALEDLIAPRNKTRI